MNVAIIFIRVELALGRCRTYRLVFRRLSCRTVMRTKVGRFLVLKVFGVMTHAVMMHEYAPGKPSTVAVVYMGVFRCRRRKKGSLIGASASLSYGQKIGPWSNLPSCHDRCCHHPICSSKSSKRSKSKRTEAGMLKIHVLVHTEQRKKDNAVDQEEQWQTQPVDVCVCEQIEQTLSSTKRHWHF